MNTELRKLQAAVYDLECASSDIRDKGLISAVEGVIKSFDALSFIPLDAHQYHLFRQQNVFYAHFQL